MLPDNPSEVKAVVMKWIDCLMRDRERTRELSMTVLYGIVFATLFASIAVAFRSFFHDTATIDEISSDVHRHLNPALLFFGVGYSMEACRHVYLQPGSLKLGTLFQSGYGCTSKQTNLVLDRSAFSYVTSDQHKLAGTDFLRYIQYYISSQFPNANEGESMNISLIAIEGPAAWLLKDTIYVKLTSPAEDFLHPFYVFMTYSLLSQKMEMMEAEIASGNTLEALALFNDVVSAEWRSYRMLPAKMVSMYSMIDVINQQDGQMVMRRMTLEPTYFDDFNGGLFNCETIHEISSNNQNGFDMPELADCLDKEANPNRTWSESMYRWHDGTVAEKNSYRHRDPWTIISTLTTAILALDRLMTTVTRYQTKKKAKKQKMAQEKGKHTETDSDKYLQRDTAANESNNSDEKQSTFNPKEQSDKRVTYF